MIIMSLPTMIQLTAEHMSVQTTGADVCDKLMNGNIRHHSKKMRLIATPLSNHRN
jgi:hypothetical protein